MGIPKQILEAEAEADKELEAMDAATKQGATIEVDGHSDPEVSVQPNAQDAPVKRDDAHEEPPAKTGIVSNTVNGDRHDDELAALRAENQRMKSEWGRMSKAYKNNEELRRKIEEMNAEMAELRENMSARETSNAPVGEELIERLRSKLGSEYDDDQINSFADAVREVVGDATKEFKTKFNQMEEQRSRSASTEFLGRIRNEFPGFLEMDESNDSRLTEFYNLPISSVSDETYGDVAKRASSALDYRSLARIIKAFAARYDIVFSPNGNVGSQQVAVRPDSHAGTNTGYNAPKRYARSEIENFRHAVFAKKAGRDYGMTDQQIVQRLDAYEEAEAYGLVDESR